MKNSTNNMKGTQTGVLIMTALLILSFVMAVTTLPLNQGLAKEISDGYKDLSRISEAKTFGDMRHHNEGLPAAEYSINNQSVELGKNGGDLAWMDSNIPTISSISSELQKEANNKIYDQYSGTDSLKACKSPNINHTLETKPTLENSVRLNVSTHKGSKQTNKQAEFYCNYTNTLNNYTSKEPKFGSNFEESTTASRHTAESNRYYKVSKITIDFFNDLNNELQSVNKKHTGTSGCICGGVGPSHKETALEGAISSAESAISTAKSNSVSSTLPVPVWASFSSRFTISDSFTWGATENTNKFEGNLNTEVNVCGCCGRYCNTDKERAKATINLDKTSVKSMVKDKDPSNEVTGRKILTDEGWKNLKFIVDSYIFNF